MEKKITKAKQKQLNKLAIKKKDKEWATRVREKSNNLCAYCNSNKNPNAAHIIPREIESFRWDLDNGICLCSKHHKFRPKEIEDKSLFSAHFNPFAFLLWFSNSHTEQFTRLVYKWSEYIDTKR